MLPRRQQVLLMLAVATLVCGGAVVGLLAWWTPIDRPAVIVLASSPDDSVSLERSLAMTADGIALAQVMNPHGRLITDDVAPTRAEMLHYVNMIRLAKPHEHVLMQISAVAGVTPTGELMLFTSDAGPLRIEGATALDDLLDAIGSCRAAGLLVLLDLIPADEALLDVLPPTNVATVVDEALRKANLGRATIIASHAPGEHSQRMAFVEHTAFGWAVRCGLRGEADGTIDGRADGRITSRELIEYVSEQTPQLALRLAGRVQHPVVYGDTPAFDLAVAQRPDQLHVATEYPKWLFEAWSEWYSHRASVDDVTALTWQRLLRKLEMSAMTANDPQALVQDRAVLAKYRTQLTTTAADVSTLTSAIQQYLHARRDALAAASPAQANATEQKLIAEFLKAHASAALDDVAPAVTSVASDAAFASADDWQALARLLDSWPKLPDSEMRSYFASLIKLRQTAASDVTLAEAARLSLRLTVECENLNRMTPTWPWSRALLDEILNQRTHGDTLLWARGYARTEAALEVLQSATQQMHQLMTASQTLEASMRSMTANRRFLIDHAYLAVDEQPLVEAWAHAIEALTELQRLLSPPPQPLSSMAQLQALVRDVTTASAAVEGGMLALRDRLNPLAVAQAITACQQSDADAHDMVRADWLLRSGTLAPEQRRDLWQATAPLVNRLLAASHTPTQLPDDRQHSAAALSRRRALMHSAWQTFKGHHTSGADATAEEVALWESDWRRFRTGELARVIDTTQPPVWSSADLQVMGPYEYSGLSPASPRARLELLWQTRTTDGAPPTVSATTPDDGLQVNVVTPNPEPNWPARFELRLASTAQRRFAGEGFLAQFTAGVRTYHVPIRLPGAQDFQEINILLSSSSTELHASDVLPLVGDNQAWYLWLENSTASPRQVSVAIGNVPPGPPVALAPLEMRYVPLALTTSVASQTELAIRVSDVASQRILAQRTYPFFAPSSRKLIACKSARIENDITRGAHLTVDLELAKGSEVPVTIALELTGGQSNRSVAITSGRSIAGLSVEHRSQTCSATIERLAAGEPIRCAVSVAGVSEPLWLSGKFPPVGDSTTLQEVSVADISLSGNTVSQPVDNYVLGVNSIGAPDEAHVRLTLRHPADNSILLSRVVPAQAPAVATLSPTVPPGGIDVSPVTAPPTQAFDTSGFVGRFTWHAELTSGATSLASGELPVVFDNTPPSGCRFVRPLTSATKETLINLEVSGWDDLTNITKVELFLGKPVDGKAPPTARLFPASPLDSDANVWQASVLTPSDLGPCDVTAIIINGAGLSSMVTTSLDILAALPAAAGEIRGAVLEGSLAQQGLEVTLEKAPGAVLKTTKTDENGQFVFDGIAPGSYTVRATKQTSQRKGSATAKVEAGQTITATIRLAL